MKIDKNQTDSSVSDKNSSNLDQPFSLDQIKQDLLNVDLGLLKDCDSKECESIYPSKLIISSVIDDIISLLFPNYFFNHEIKKVSLGSFLSSTLDSVEYNLSNQIQKCFCLSSKECLNDCKKISLEKTHSFLSLLPSLQHTLLQDASAAYRGDPASTSIEEVILCYPGFSAIIKHRIAHAFYKLEVPLLPRIISEISHSQTGIDIHPGALIGKNFFIDHGTGVVIGQTAIIGDNVKIYQGVTLGAKSFDIASDGTYIKGIPRHPIVEDNVTIYAEATVLGRITIGKNSIIGANTWIVKDVAPGSKIYK